MSAEDRAKWDGRYAEGAYQTRPHPSAFLAANTALLPPGHALDLACGAGRNAIFLAQRGWTVDAVDISAVALERVRDRATGLAIRWLEQDLDAGFDPPRDYDLIVNVRYVNLPLLRALLDCLRPGGTLLVEQHLTPPDHAGTPVLGPRDSAFRVAPGALQAVADGLQVRRLHEGLVRDPDGSIRALARLIAAKPPMA